MAKFILVDENKYKIIGILNQEDIKRINSFKNRTTIILDNTVGLSSELISKINSDRVVFSIKGGLDYDSKEKYKLPKYVDRTFVSPYGLVKILKYFEYTERMIDPNWNEFEKAMFLYNALVVDMEYAEDYENIQSKGTTERSLNGILYGKLVCSGFALVYKEMLDRVGIKNYYQNQTDIHSFNVIEIDGKKYGVDVTWDNNDKKNHGGRCGFGAFAHDSDFYTRNGHQLYRDIDVSDDFEITNIERVYDSDEDIFDLSTLSMEQLEKYYSHIEQKINKRKPARYNLQDQSLEVKYKHLPVDTVDLRLKQERVQEYPIMLVLNFLKKENALQINPQLLSAYSGRMSYLLDMYKSEKDNMEHINLSSIGMENYAISRYGQLYFINNGELEHIHSDTNELYSRINQHLSEYLNNYVLGIINNLDTLLENYEYAPDEWDNNRAVECVNIRTKLALIINSRDYLIQLGVNETKLDNIIHKIENKYNETDKYYAKHKTKKDIDLDFLSASFDDLNMILKTMEYDLQKEITQEEFVSLYCDVDYMIQLFEKHIIVAGDKKFSFDEYDISKKDLEQLLYKTIQKHQKNKPSIIKKNKR